MKYRVLGHLGWRVSEFGFGAWAIGGTARGMQDDSESVRALHKALDPGCNFIDTARGYGDGHVCVLTPGHNLEVWRHPAFQQLLSKALHRAAKLD